MFSSTQLSSLLENWDIEPAFSAQRFKTPNYRCSSNSVFIETATEKFVLKHVTVQPGRKLDFALVAALHSHGVPVAVPKLTCQGEPYAKQGDEYFSLSPYLPGGVISDHYAPGSEERARLFGAAIAQLHIGLIQCQHLVEVPEMDLLRDVTAGSRVIGALSGDTLAGPLQKVFSELIIDLTAVNQALPVQLIHRDAHPDNILFLDNRLSGWLDFELAVRGPRLFDLGYCATSILMNGLEDPAKRHHWLTLLAALVEGYSTLNPLTTVERSALWVVLLSIEVIFAAYFTRLKEERGVAQNLEALLWIYENRNRIQKAGTPA